MGLGFCFYLLSIVRLFDYIVQGASARGAATAAGGGSGGGGARDGACSGRDGAMLPVGAAEVGVVRLMVFLLLAMLLMLPRAAAAPPRAPPPPQQHWKHSNHHDHHKHHHGHLYLHLARCARFRWRSHGRRHRRKV